MFRKLALLLALLVLLSVGGIALFVAGVYAGVFGDLPRNNELRGIKNETASLVYSQEGVMIGKYFAQNRTNIKYHDFPEHLVNALIATEDARFFEHSGIDYRGLMRVFLKSLLLGNERSGGGSTLSQQLAKNLYGRQYHGPLSLPVNKVKEAILAGRIEDLYAKDEVLTLYFNTVPFGENVYGVEAAAIRFFNCQAKDLRPEQSAVLVGMLKANTYYNPRLYPENALRRRNTVLYQMEKYNYLEAQTTDSLTALSLGLNYSDIRKEGPAKYFLRQVKREAQAILNSLASSKGVDYDIEKDGLIITTTLHHEMQKAALDAFKKHLGKMQPLLEKHYMGGRRQSLESLAHEQLLKAGLKPENDVRRNRELFGWNGFYRDSITAADSIIHDLTLLHAGLVAMDPQSGAIRTWVGGIDYRSQPYDQITARRQLASAFKPILYAAALESGITPCSYLPNDTLVFKDFGNWAPRNYDHSSGGSYSMAGALSKSANLPTVSLMFDIERQNLESLWTSLGFESELPEGPSVALGSGSASALELCVSYAAFANGGFVVTPTFIEQISTADGEILYSRPHSPRRESVLSAQSALLMQQMMLKVVNEGTATSLRSVYGVHHPVAGKTGTSQDYADAWFGAFTPKLVTVARVGASLPDVHFNSGRYGSGSALALPLIGLMLSECQSNAALRDFAFASFPPLPEHLTELMDCPDFKEPSMMDELFDLFKSQKTTQKRERQKAEKREEQRQKKKDGLLQRWFGKKKNKN